jgi:hypothetical protein
MTFFKISKTGNLWSRLVIFGNVARDSEPAFCFQDPEATNTTFFKISKTCRLLSRFVVFCRVHPETRNQKPGCGTPAVHHSSSPLPSALCISKGPPFWPEKPSESVKNRQKPSFRKMQHKLAHVESGRTIPEPTRAMQTVPDRSRLKLEAVSSVVARSHGFDYWNL